VSLDNIVLLHGSAINSDAPFCPLWGSAEIDYISSTNYSSYHNEWASDQHYNDTYSSIHMWNDEEQNQLYLRNYYGFSAYVYMKNDVTPFRSDGSIDNLSKETYDGCLATLIPHLPELYRPNY
jgi:hypothetical protein